MDPYKREAKVDGLKIWPHVNYRIVIRDTLRIYQRKRWRMLDLDVNPVGELVSEEYRYLNIPHEPITFSRISKQKMVQGVLLLFSQKRLKMRGKSPYDVELLKQLREQEKLKSDYGNDLYDHPENSHDDLFWSLCLAVNAARRYLFEPRTAVYSSLDFDKHLTGQSANEIAFRGSNNRWESVQQTAAFVQAYSADSAPRPGWLPRPESEKEKKEQDDEEEG